MRAGVLRRPRVALPLFSHQAPGHLAGLFELPRRNPIFGPRTPTFEVRAVTRDRPPLKSHTPKHPEIVLKSDSSNTVQALV